MARPDLWLLRRLGVIESIKLLGIQISENLKWQENIEYIYKKAKTKIFLLRNMKKSGLTTPQLVDAYKKR